jgi:hypothetical protein
MSELWGPSSVRLIDLYNMMKSKSLVLRPVFQRNLVWNNKHKENFIETILRKLPFPEIYIADGEIDLVSQTAIRVVVDGQQRLNTIYQYIEGDEEFVLKRIPPFAELSEGQQTDFYDYRIVVRDLGRIEEDTIKEIFSRINSVQYALNAVEVQHALYQGEYISTAREIVGGVVGELFNVFTEAEFTRMKDLEFVLLVMSTIEENGYFSGYTTVSEYVKEYDSEYANKEAMIDSIVEVFKFIKGCKLELDSIWFRKSSFFTLVVELVKYYKEKGSLPNIKNTRANLAKFEERVYASKGKDVEKDRFAQYYFYTFQGTNGRTGRNARGSLLREWLLSFSEPVS